jgi:hypothetical protein
MSVWTGARGRGGKCLLSSNRPLGRLGQTQPVYFSESPQWLTPSGTGEGLSLLAGAVAERTARVCVRSKSDHGSLLSCSLRHRSLPFFSRGQSHRTIPSGQALMPCPTQGKQNFGGRMNYRSSTCLLLLLSSRGGCCRPSCTLLIRRRVLYPSN